MALIALICKEEKERRELALAVEELGHRVASAPALREGLELLERERPQLMLVVEGAGEKLAEKVIGELETEAPLLPLVVAQTKRQAPRALELLKAGVYEVLPPPWTPESVAACLSKALRFKGTAFEIVRRPDPVRRTAYGGTFALLLVALLGYAALEQRRRSLEPAPAAAASWELPYSHPAGLAYDGKEFWVSDWFSQSVYRHSRLDLRASRSRHFPKEIPGALAFAADALMTAAAPHHIVKHMLDDKLTVLHWQPDAMPQTVGMAYDGLYLWTCDAGGRLHKRILDEALSVVESYDYPGGAPAALAYDGRSLWSLDAGNRELLRHDMSRPDRITSRIDLPEYRSGQWKPTGLAWDGQRFWTVAESRPKGEQPGRIFMHAGNPNNPRGEAP